MVALAHNVSWLCAVAIKNALNFKLKTNYASTKPN